MRVIFTGRRFVCQCNFAERDLPKRVGFFWDPTEKEWYTSYHGTAARLREYADDGAKREIAKVLLTNEPWTRGLQYPTDLRPYKFQLEAAKFALSGNRRYLALDPRLGKTIVAAIVAANLGTPTYYICPPALVENTLIEFERWAPNTFVHVVADSKLGDPLTRVFFKTTVEAGATLFVDEAHRFANLTAIRTKNLLGFKKKGEDEIIGLASLFDRIYFLSGTPMRNRPMELFPILSKYAPETIDYMNKFDYGRYYCQGKHNGFGWDFSGAARIDELSARLRKNFMLRLRREDVFTELPPKIEEVVILNSDGLSGELFELDRKLLEKYSPEDLMAKALGDPHISTYRAVLGVEKVEPAVEYINHILEDTDEAIIVVAIHKGVISGLRMGLKKWQPLVIDGSVPTGERQALKEKYRTSPEHRIMLINVEAGGVGFNFSKASRVVFVEWSWVPSDNDQAMDRMYDMTKETNVFAQYLTYRNSVDRTVLENNLRKRNATQRL